jgi:hypothetical protein
MIEAGLFNSIPLDRFLFTTDLHLSGARLQVVNRLQRKLFKIRLYKKNFSLLDQVWSKTNTEYLNLSYLILLKYHFHGD